MHIVPQIHTRLALLRDYEPGSHPLLGRGTPFEKQTSLKSISVCSDAIYRIAA